MSLKTFLISNFDSNRLIHSVKTAIAFLFGFIVSKILQLPSEQWLLITIVVVMCAQSRIGAIMQKSYMRFLGTFLGAGIAVLAIYFGVQNSTDIILILCFTVMLFSYIAEGPGVLSDAGPLGAVTAVIILVGQQPDIKVALMRFLEINIGIVIALLVSRFIWPLHSKARLLRVITSALVDLKDYYAEIIRIKPPADELLYDTREEKIIKRLIVERKLFEEVVRESFSRAPLAKEFKNILYCERELLRCISMMSHVFSNFSSEAFFEFSNNALVKLFYQQSQELLERIISAMYDNNSIETKIDKSLPLNWKFAIKNELALKIGNEEDMLQVDSFLYCAERMLQQLNKFLVIIPKIK